MKLADKAALVIGAGGLGCPAAVGLAAAGIGRLTLIDDDRVDATNLARQMLFGEGDIGEPKAVIASGALLARFPQVQVRAVVRRFTREDRELVAEHHAVLDASDNFPTRFAVNDVCVDAGVPLVHGAALQWRGQVLTILPGRGPCLRCVFESEPPREAGPTCGEVGVIAPLVGVIGEWMAQAAIDALWGRAAGDTMHVLDAWTDRERLVPIGRDPECAVCARLVIR